jgi:hypothetical protein
MHVNLVEKLEHVMMQACSFKVASEHVTKCQQNIQNSPLKSLSPQCGGSYSICLVLKCTVRLAPSENERVALTLVLRCKYIFLARLVWYRASFWFFSTIKDG